MRLSQEDKRAIEQFVNHYTESGDPVIAFSIGPKIRRALEYIATLEADKAKLCSIIRAEQMPEGYDIEDDATTELAVELAQVKAENAKARQALEYMTPTFEHYIGILDNHAITRFISKDAAAIEAARIFLGENKKQ